MTVGIFCFDTSAMSKLVLRNEPGAELVAAIWDSEGDVHTGRLGYPESCSAIIKAQRNGRLPEHDLGSALDQFEHYWQDVAVVELNSEIASRAREHVLRFALSGADAVHVASAIAIAADAEVTFVTWDQRQAAAAVGAGLAVSPATI